jgi:long-chain acyl-CoA synthetase
MQTGRNLYLDLPQNAPQSIAILERGRPTTFEELFGHIDRYARYLCAQGVTGRDRVGILGLTNLEYLAAVYACARIGAAAVPLPAEDPVRFKAAREAARVRLLVEQPVPDVHATVISSHNPEAMVIFTSGTTSEGRKGVILGHEGISSTAAFMNRAMNVDRSIRECVYAPLDHAFAFGRCHAVLMAGGTLMLEAERRGFEPLFDSLARGANALSTVPSMLATLLRLSEARLKAAGAGLRWIQTGAMRFDRAFRDQLCRVFPGARIFLHYGLSEAMRVTFIELHETPLKRHTEGQPADGVEIAILDENGERLGPGSEGRIAVRGRNLALGYVDNEAWQRCLRDGWFVTADRGSLDEDGYLVFAGRSDDVINVNGNLVHPDEIESRLFGFLGRHNFSVVGVSDPRNVKDKVVVLAVEGDPGIGLEEIVEAMAGTVDYMIPHRLVKLERLPRTASGKVSRAMLAKELADRLK